MCVRLLYLLIVGFSLLLMWCCSDPADIGGPDAGSENQYQGNRYRLISGTGGQQLPWLRPLRRRHLVAWNHSFLHGVHDTL